jgi:cyclic dehypoxanthinyl futalosine synthase
MMEENVVSAAGTTYCLNEAMICRLIRDAGFLPAQRGNDYNLLRVHAGTDAPDLIVEDWSTLRAQRLHVESVEPPEGKPGQLPISRGQVLPTVEIPVPVPRNR